MVFDSDLDREYTDGNPNALNHSSVLFFPLSHNGTSFGFPRSLIKSYRIEIEDAAGHRHIAVEVKDNHLRFVKHMLNTTAKAVHFIPLSTYHSERKNNDYGCATAHLFNYEIF